MCTVKINFFCQILIFFYVNLYARIINRLKQYKRSLRFSIFFT